MLSKNASIEYEEVNKEQSDNVVNKEPSFDNYEQQQPVESIANKSFEGKSEDQMEKYNDSFEKVPDNLSI